MPVCIGDAPGSNHRKPLQERFQRLPPELGHVSRGTQVGLLDDIGRVDLSCQVGPDPSGQAVLQAIAVDVEEAGECVRVALSQPLQQLLDFAIDLLAAGATTVRSGPFFRVHDMLLRERTPARRCPRDRRPCFSITPGGTPAVVLSGSSVYHCRAFLRGLSLASGGPSVANVLVVGRGGREHALAWKLAQSPHVQAVYVAPGNAGTAREFVNVPIDPGQFDQLIAFASERGIDLTVVGPEAPLCAGIVDAFRAAGLRIFGPTQQAAQLEGSKVFAKELMRRAGIPTAEFVTFDDPDEADRYLRSLDETPVVVKADGLAAGKGSIVCHTRKEAFDAVDLIMRQRAFGSAGDRIVIEEKLSGEELSVLAICDGKTIARLEPAQDHKPAYDGDRGPNTGGMGAYSPAPMATAELLEEVDQRVLVPAVHQMRKEGIPFQGVLYAGLMLTPAGPKVLEFNVRFGDPECQPLMMRLQTDLYELLNAAADGRLDQLSPLSWDERAALCVVLAAEGYPGKYTKGLPVTGIEEAEQMEDVKVFHAGTALRDGQVVVDGGRILGVTALGETLPEAKRKAYEAIRLIKTPGGWCRHDIGDKALRWLMPRER